MMKSKLMNFRLPTNTVLLLEDLAKKRGKSMTAVINEAIHILASKEEEEKPYMEFFGILADDKFKILDEMTKIRKSKPVIKL